jgi:hypothetical protein
MGGGEGEFRVGLVVLILDEFCVDVQILAFGVKEDVD